MELLIERYQNKRHIFLSGDAAYWHISKQLKQSIDAHNASLDTQPGAIVDIAPLPSGAQFLNVIESVFSGMSRAIIDTRRRSICNVGLFGFSAMGRSRVSRLINDKFVDVTGSHLNSGDPSISATDGRDAAEGWYKWRQVAWCVLGSRKEDLVSSKRRTSGAIDAVDMTEIVAAMQSIEYGQFELSGFQLGCA